MSCLCCHFRAFFPLFYSCKSSDLNSQSYSSFSSKKINHFLTKPSTLFLSPVSLSSCLLRFHVSPNLSIDCFFLFLELSFFRFRYQTVFFECLLQFYVHFLKISLLGLQEVATLTSRIVFEFVLFMKLVK